MLKLELEKKEKIMLNLNSKKKPIRIADVLNEVNHIEDDIRDDINKIRINQITELQLYGRADTLLHFLCVYNYQTKKFSFRSTKLTNSDFDTDTMLDIDGVDEVNSLIIRMDFSAKTTPTQDVATVDLDTLVNRIADKMKRKIKLVMGKINRLPIDTLYSSEQYGCSLAKLTYCVNCTALNRKWFLPLNAFTHTELAHILKFATTCNSATRFEFDFAKYYDQQGLQLLMDEFKSLFLEYQKDVEIKMIENFVEDFAANPEKFLSITFNEMKQKLTYYYEPDELMSRIIEPVLKRNHNINKMDVLKMWIKYYQDFCQDRLSLAHDEEHILTHDFIAAQYSGKYYYNAFDYNIASDMFRPRNDDSNKIIKVYCAFDYVTIRRALVRMIKQQTLVDDYSNCDKLLVVPSKQFVAKIVNEKFSDIPTDVFQMIVKLLEAKQNIQIITLDELFARQDIFEIKEQLLDKELFAMSVGFDNKQDLAELINRKLVFTTKSWADEYNVIKLHKI